MEAFWSLHEQLRVRDASRSGLADDSCRRVLHASQHQILAKADDIKQ